MHTNTTAARSANLRPYNGSAGRVDADKGRPSELYLILTRSTPRRRRDGFDDIASITPSECDALLHRYRRPERAGVSASGKGNIGPVKLTMSESIAPAKPNDHQVVIVLGRNEFTSVRRKFASRATKH